MSEEDVPKKVKKVPSGEYPVGYGRPPRETRWKKGTSGNPGGRKRGPSPQMLTDMMRDTLQKKITINGDGKEERITMLEAAVRRQVNDLVSGTAPQRLRTFIQLYHLGVLNPLPESMRFNSDAAAALVARLAATVDECDESR